ncbi:hypothetical protein BT63DRAFT_424089, partial [Microthyrium microscopicum]
MDIDQHTFTDPFNLQSSSSSDFDFSSMLVTSPQATPEDRDDDRSMMPPPPAPLSSTSLPHTPIPSTPLQIVTPQPTRPPSNVLRTTSPFIPRRRSVSMPPEASSSFTRRLNGTGDLRPLGQPRNRPSQNSAPASMRAHPYESARRQRFQTPPTQSRTVPRRAPTSPQDGSRPFADGSGAGYTDAYSVRRSGVKGRGVPSNGLPGVMAPKSNVARHVHKLMEKILHSAHDLEVLRREAVVLEVEPELRAQRGPIRMANFTVSSIDQPLQLIEPVAACNIQLPQNGLMINKLTRNGVDELLRVYDLPVPKELFLHEKKIIYMNFIGLSPAMMHLILDNFYQM